MNQSLTDSDKVGLINQALTEYKKCGFDESNPYDIIIRSYQV